MNRRIRILLLGATALAALGSPTAGFAQTKLIGTVGPAHKITFEHENGTRVTDIPAGTYTIEVRDLADVHNFHLFGPGVNMRTEVEAIGTTTWTVTFRDNARYTFQCDPHFSTLRGTFTIGGGPPPPPPPPPPQATLTATVGPGATISLRTANGRRVTQLRAGRYRIVVRDRSSVRNFHLIGPSVNRKTTVAFRGTRAWTLTLRRGSYRYVCDPDARRLKGSFRVT